MGYWEPETYLKRKRCGSRFRSNLISLLIFMVAVTSQVSVRLDAQDPSKSSTEKWGKLKLTSTIRPWPTHDFFLNAISESTTRNESKTAERGVLESHDQLNTSPASISLIPSMSKISKAVETHGSTGDGQNEEDIGPLSRQWIFTTPTVIPGSQRFSEKRLPSNPIIDAELPMRVLSKKVYQYPIRNHTPSYGKVGGSYNFESDGNAWHVRRKDTPGYEAQIGQQAGPTVYSNLITKAKYSKSSAAVVITSVAIPMATGPTETTKIPWESIVTRNPAIPLRQHKVSAVHWGVSSGSKPHAHLHHPISEENVEKLAEQVSPTAPAKPVPAPIKTALPTTIWYKPTINQYSGTAPENRKNGSAKVDLDLKSTEQPPPQTLEKPAVSTGQILFKIWSYFDGEMKLHSQKEVPNWVLDGYNFSADQVLNLDQIPEAVKEEVTSALNSSSTISKRHSGPGNDIDYHWQRLPVILPDDSSPSWKPPRPVTRRPVSLNYVIWSSTATPPPLRNPAYLDNLYARPSTPTPGFNHEQYLAQYLFYKTTPAPPLMDSGLDSWLKLQCYLKDKMNSPSLASLDFQGNSGNTNKMPDKDVLSNLAALSVILSHVNKASPISSSNGGSGFENAYPESPKIPSSDISGMKPPHRDAFWSSLYPIYQHLVNKGLAASSIIRKPKPRPVRLPGYPSTFSDGEEDPSHLENFSGGYNFYPNQDIISITENPVDDQTKTLLKKGKKGLKKLKKKAQKRKKKKGKGDFSFFDPSKLEFSADFGVDFLGMLKRKFYTLVALKLAPLIILTGLALLPLLLLVWPKILGWLKLGYAVYRHYKPKFGHHQPHHGWNPHHSNQYPGFHQNQGHFGGKRFNGVGEVHHHFHDYPPPEIDSLVQSTYGDLVHRSSNANTDFDQVAVPSDLVEEDLGAYYDPELDTEHNRRVMEILMDNKNVTLHKLLENWALERNSTYFPEPRKVSQRRKRKRKKRNSYSRSYLQV